MHCAFECLALEIEHSAYDLSEPSVATGKLEWWAEELMRSAAGAPQHPLTLLLAKNASFAGAPWGAVIAGATAQHAAPASADLAALLMRHSQFHAPVSIAEATLFDGIDPDATARSRSLVRSVRDSVAGMREGFSSSMPLPLDLLARHQLTRASLAQGGPARMAALRDHLGTLLERFEALAVDAAGLPLLQVAAVSANRARLRIALRASEPVNALEHAFGSLPPLTAWKVWRCARQRQRAS